jgi:predicted O-methyltransferase YrrM
VNFGWLRKVVNRRSQNVRSPLPTLASMDWNSGLGDSAFLLYGLARARKPEVAVEIGSARGKSACFIGAALKENGNGKLYAIDPHTPNHWNDENSPDTLETMKRNIKTLRLESHVEIIRDTSEKAAVAWNRPIDLLFIDGDHSYDGVKSDWDRFSPFVTKFGAVVFHDTLWDLHPDPRFAREDMGVPSFVEELRRDGYPVITLDKDFGVSLVQPERHGVCLQAEPRVRAR